MADIVRRPHVRSDLLDIWEFVADDDETTADGVLDRIEAALIVLAGNPFAGRARPELAYKLRSFSIGNYAIFYRPIDGGIDVVRVLSGYRDIGQTAFEP